LAIGVVGRWLQPDWNFTPLAAVTVMGGYYFRQWLPAVLLPVGILAVSDLLLPAHNSLVVLVSVHVMMLVPLVLGRGFRHAQGWVRPAGLALCGVIPATAFFVATNFAVWTSTSYYAKTWSGLMECYAAGVPFYRAMLAGDLLYLGILAACLATATHTASARTKLT
jgi:hypothetical protein